MEIDEDVDSMYTRFTKIVNASRSLGKNFPNGDLVRKILRSLPPRFNPKVTAIAESHEISALEIESLIGNLKTHEVELKIQAEEYPKEMKKKGLALKASKERKTSDFSEEDEEESLYVREFKKFMKNPRKQGKFKRFLKKGVEEGRKWNKSVKETDSDDEKYQPECFHCHKLGHLKRDCPRLQKEEKGKDNKYKGKKKVLKALTWDEDGSEDSSSTDSGSDNEANLCLMGKGQEESESNAESSVQSDTEVTPPTYSELLEIYDHVVGRLEEVTSKKNSLRAENKRLNKSLEKLKKEVIKIGKEKVECPECPHLVASIEEGKASHSKTSLRLVSLKNEKNVLEKKLHISLAKVEEGKKQFANRCVMLVTENTALKARIHDLNCAVQKFGVGQKSLNMLLGAQCHGSGKFGIGYVSPSSPLEDDSTLSTPKSTNKIKNLNTLSPSSSKRSSEMMKVISSAYALCANCNKFGHASSSCGRKGAKQNAQVWLPKSTTYKIGGTTWVTRSLLSSPF
ncbi:hypothetical protein KSP39_PZI011548 [Platanthera zijinensis]|uniref:CCHC-type domain-containing protein n=1 Tax=Platanthera zijinensis TaxID=2320716 RepID=A0AAP0G5S0_9ASPA